MAAMRGGALVLTPEKEERVVRNPVQKSTRRLDCDPEQPASPGARVCWEEHRQDRIKDADVRRFIEQAVLRILRGTGQDQQLAEADVPLVAEAAQYFVWEPGDTIEAEGKHSSHFFVVEEGCLEVNVGGHALDTLTSGCTYGSSSFLACGNSTSSVVAQTRVGLWATSTPTFKQLLRRRAEQYSVENRNFFESAFFAGLPAKQLDLLSLAFSEETVEAGTVVVAKGEATNALYLVRQGTLRVIDGTPADTASDTDGIELARIGPGHCFGERALLYSETRAATVVALDRCQLLRGSKEQLQEALGQDLQVYLERCLLLSVLRGSPAYSQFPAPQQSAITNSMEMKDYSPGAGIEAPTAEDLRLLIVVRGEFRRRGRVVVSRGEHVDDRFHPIFGDEGQEAGSPSHGRGHADSGGSRLENAFHDLAAGPHGARAAIISREGLAQALAPHSRVANAEQADECAKKMLLVKKVPLFRHLSQDHTEKVVSAFKIQRYARGARVIQQGDPGDALFVIARGEVTVTINGRLIRTQGRNACFGERALLFDELRSASVEVSSNEAELWTIDKATFGQIVKGMMREELMHRISFQDTQVTLQDLRHVEVIGAGAFSTVHLAEHKRTKVRYALKVVKKGRDGKIPVEMKNEVSILLENDHPFILHVVKTFDTSMRICMLTELVTGGDLHGAIRRIPNVLSRKQSQFYTGSLVIVIEALWDRNILYRDLKPENVMLDAQGYLKLIDFGISKKLGQHQGRTFTMVGTPHYMAPEVMRGKGYGAVIDLWSLGVMLFEFVCGYLPFADHVDTPSEVCAAVLKEPLSFPRGFRDKEGKDLIKALLTRLPEKRLGAGGLAQVKGNAYFRVAGEDDPDALFDKLMGRELQPPLVPEGETYCDPEETEDCTLSDVEELWPPEGKPAAQSEGKATPASDTQSALVPLRSPPTIWRKLLCCL